jgi:dethiobiotin synthetase
MIPTGNYFVTGTDTGIGKTYVACRWIEQQRTQGVQIAPMKPISAGCTQTSEGFRNDDAEQLIAASGMSLPYERVNRYAFKPAIAPHIAAAEAGVSIEADSLVEDFQWLRQRAQGVCVEGAGGWRVPLGGSLQTADIPKALGIDVVLVVGIRLGCLNHALLTAEAIETDGCRLAGWIANFLDPSTERAEENFDFLHERIPAPLLWSLKHEKIAGSG